MFHMYFSTKKYVQILACPLAWYTHQYNDYGNELNYEISYEDSLCLDQKYRVNLISDSGYGCNCIYWAHTHWSNKLHAETTNKLDALHTSGLDGRHRCIWNRPRFMFATVENAMFDVEIRPSSDYRVTRVGTYLVLTNGYITTSYLYIK